MQVYQSRSEDQLNEINQIQKVVGLNVLPNVDPTPD